ncbi:hypothetical protein I3843_16G060100 [Carya illinoinensis]|nr:hypothetical protein I3843_16G060100 [Carya illinoinensis]
MLFKLLQTAIMICRFWSSAKASCLVTDPCMPWLMVVLIFQNSTPVDVQHSGTVLLHIWLVFAISQRFLNLCGCVKAASDSALQAIGCYCSQLQSLSLGWCDNVSDEGVMSLAYGCPDLRALDLCGCVCITGISYGQ